MHSKLPIRIENYRETTLQCNPLQQKHYNGSATKPSCKVFALCDRQAFNTQTLTDII